MSTATREREVQDATTAYQLALSRIGVRTTAEALALWDDVPAGSKPTVAAKWLNTAVKLIMSRRSMASDLALAYYRLVRALETGRTVVDPKDEPGQTVTLGQLRREFATLSASQGASSGSGGNDTGQGGNGSQEPTPPPQDGSSASDTSDDDDAILQDEIKHLEELERENEKAAEEEIRIALQALGPAKQDKFIAELEADDLTVEEYKAALDQAHIKAGSQQAAAAARIGMNGGRTTSWLLQENDSLAMGYVRVSLTGTPCGWCAMLISRGPVYKSSNSAQYVEGDQYHDNCHCIAVPVFSDEQYENDPRFALNRKYAEQWPKVTKGLGGKDALSAWRRFIRTEQA